MTKEMLEYLKYSLPFEIKKEASLISLFISLIVISILGGFLNELGAKILSWMLELKIPFFPETVKTIRLIALYPIQTNPLIILVFIVSFYLLSHSLSRLKLKETIVFEDDFSSGNKGWWLNYWHSKNEDKTCRFENNSMVFEADESDLVPPQKENGACIDLIKGIYQGSKYEIYCWVKSSRKTTMGFKLWVHDKDGHAEMKSSPDFSTPSTRYTEVKVPFIATKSQALRVHLHYKAGVGKIFVNKVKVVRVS